jgi:hypothetical protein
MSALTIHHHTSYRYRTPMAFGPHWLMLRPRESHALRLHAHELAIAPAAVVTDTLSLLKDISAEVAAQFAYETREDEGAQAPDETLARRSGSCR